VFGRTGFKGIRSFDIVHSEGPLWKFFHFAEEHEPQGVFFFNVQQKSLLCVVQKVKFSLFFIHVPIFEFPTTIQD